MRFRYSRSLLRALLTLIAVICVQWSIALFRYRYVTQSVRRHQQQAPAALFFSDPVVNRKSDAHDGDWRKIVPQFNVRAVNCSMLFAGKENEFLKATKFHKTYNRPPLADEDYVDVNENCTQFQSTRGYIMSHQTDDERTFPIAFSILMHEHVEQTERLLRAIYRPQNYYCIHVDRKARKVVYAAIADLAACFDNVFISTQRAEIAWSKNGLLEADLFCMEQLLRYKRWRYFINLTAKQFPLKTNGDLVRILRAYNGANDVMGITYKLQSRSVRKRYEKSIQHPPPFNIVPVKGSMHVTLSRAFVEWLFVNEAALQFRRWISDVPFPEESFISTLNYNPHLKAPGAYSGDPDTLQPPFLSCHELWLFDASSIALCRGERRNSLCVFGVRDLPYLHVRRELFLNRVMLDFQPLTYDCLEEWHFARTRDEYDGKVYFDSAYYAQTQFARNHA